MSDTNQSKKFTKLSKFSSQFKLSNIFNFRSVLPFVLVFTGVTTGVEIAWMENSLGASDFFGAPLEGMHPGLKWMSYIGGGALAAYNAHSIGSKSILFNNVAANAARNALFISASAAGGMLFGIGLSISLGLGATSALPVAGAVAAFGVINNALALSWRPKKTTPAVKFNAPS